MRKIILSICLLLAINSIAQTKKLSIEDAVIGRWRQFYPEDLAGVKWRNNNDFTYVKDWSIITQLNSENKSSVEIINIRKINDILSNNSIDNIRYISDYEWDSNNVIRLDAGSHIVRIDVVTSKLISKIKYNKEAKNKHYCKASKTLAFTVENNLYIANESGKTIQITHDTDKGIVNGDAYVHRQEFGIDKGIFWSPKGNYIAFYRKDETMVADYPLVDVTTRIASLKNIKYPMAGEISEQVTLGIYNVKTGKTVFVKKQGDKEDFLTRITWDPSEKYLYIAELNRGQNHMHLNKFDANNGNFIKTLFEEKHPKYVEPEHDMYFLNTKPNQFVWFSERDNYQHLYLYETSGKLIKQLTKGKYVVTDFLGFDEKDKNFYAITTMESPLGRQLYKYSTKTGKYTKLTKEKGTHTVKINKNKTNFVDKFSNTQTVNKINLCDTKGQLIRELLNSPNKLQDYKLGEMTIGTIKAADGKTDLYYRMIKPTNFDPNKKYPVIVYVYGGPHAQLIEDTWLGGAGLWDYYMAQEGYIMFTVDNRGSANRGLEFENVIHRQCGQEEMKDQMKGVDYLMSLPYVDKDRIGVDGWSYGGFMTISLILNHPDVFKVACAGGPVIDWKYYEVMYGERYMDTPQENPEGYAKASLLDKVEKLKGRLLIIHGGVDPVVVWQNSLNFLNKCIQKNVLVDYFVYPTHEHNIRGMDRIHLRKKITQYFNDFLKK